LYQRINYDLSLKLFAKLQRLSLQFHGRKAIGDQLLNVINDSACLSNVAQSVLIPAVGAVFSISVMIAIILRNNAWLVLFFLGPAPLLLFTQHHYALVRKQWR